MNDKFVDIELTGLYTTLYIYQEEVEELEPEIALYESVIELLKKNQLNCRSVFDSLYNGLERKKDKLNNINAQIDKLKKMIGEKE